MKNTEETDYDVFVETEEEEINQDGKRLILLQKIIEMEIPFIVTQSVAKLRYKHNLNNVNEKHIFDSDLCLMFHKKNLKQVEDLIVSLSIKRELMDNPYDKKETFAEPIENQDYKDIYEVRLYRNASIYIRDNIDLFNVLTNEYGVIYEFKSNNLKKFYDKCK